MIDLSGSMENAMEPSAGQLVVRESIGFKQESGNPHSSDIKHPVITSLKQAGQISNQKQSVETLQQGNLESFFNMDCFRQLLSRSDDGVRVTLEIGAEEQIKQLKVDLGFLKGLAEDRLKTFGYVCKQQITEL